MRYHDITKDDMKNGTGLRVVLWLSGCNHACPGCQNPITWDPEDGLIFDEKAKAEVFALLSKDYISGITLSGGDPLFPGNRDELLDLLKEIRASFPQKTVWCYTGYTIEEIKDLPHLDYINVLIDGPFIENLADKTLMWRGSANQKVIDIANWKKL